MKEAKVADRQGAGGRSVLRHRADRARALLSADRRDGQGDAGPARRHPPPTRPMRRRCCCSPPATTKAASATPAEQALENADRLDPNDPVTSNFETAIAIDDYDSDRAIESAQEALRRSRARGGDYAPLSANRDAGSTAQRRVPPAGTGRLGPLLRRRGVRPVLARPAMSTRRSRAAPTRSSTISTTAQARSTRRQRLRLLVVLPGADARPADAFRPHRAAPISSAGRSSKARSAAASSPHGDDDPGWTSEAEVQGFTSDADPMELLRKLNTPQRRRTCASPRMPGPGRRAVRPAVRGRQRHRLHRRQADALRPRRRLCRSRSNRKPDYGRQRSIRRFRATARSPGCGRLPGQATPTGRQRGSRLEPHLRLPQRRQRRRLRLRASTEDQRATPCSSTPLFGPIGSPQTISNIEAASPISAPSTIPMASAISRCATGSKAAPSTSTELDTFSVTLVGRSRRSRSVSPSDANDRRRPRLFRRALRDHARPQGRGRRCSAPTSTATVPSTSDRLRTARRRRLGAGRRPLAARRLHARDRRARQRADAVADRRSRPAVQPDCRSASTGIPTPSPRAGTPSGRTASSPSVDYQHQDLDDISPSPFPAG